jgi:hypothetical protein
LRQIAFELLELADTRADLGAAASDQLQDVSAWRSSKVSDSDDVAYFSNGQPDCLGGVDELQSRQDISRVRTIARRRPHGFWQYASLLVVAQRGRSQATPAGQLADSHRQATIA